MDDIFSRDFGQTCSCVVTADGFGLHLLDGLSVEQRLEPCPVLASLLLFFQGGRHAVSCHSSNPATNRSTSSPATPHFRCRPSHHSLRRRARTSASSVIFSAASRTASCSDKPCRRDARAAISSLCAQALRYRSSTWRMSASVFYAPLGESSRQQRGSAAALCLERLLSFCPPFQVFASPVGRCCGIGKIPQYR